MLLFAVIPGVLIAVLFGLLLGVIMGVTLLAMVMSCHKRYTGRTKFATIT